jgi:hypothetical protein
MRRSCLFAGLLVAVVLGQASGLRAAPAEDPEELIKVGNALRRKGDNLRAVGYIRRAYELAHTPRSAAQLGLVELAVSDFVNAEAHLTEALGSNDPWVVSNAKTVEDSRKKARGHLLRVEVVGAPADATVVLPEARILKLPEDGVLWLAPGATKLRVQSIGHKSADLEVAGAEKETRTVRVEMPLEMPAAVPVAPATTTTPPKAAEPASAEAEGASKPGEPAPTPVSAASDSGRSLRIAGIVTGAAGIAVAVVGGVVLASGNSKADDTNKAAMNAKPWNPADGNYKTLQQAGVGLLVGGGVAIATGVALYVVGAKSAGGEAATSVSLSVGPGGGVLGWGGRF